MYKIYSLYVVDISRSNQYKLNILLQITFIQNLYGEQITLHI
jgi:hypothetical protein